MVGSAMEAKEKANNVLPQTYLTLSMSINAKKRTTTKCFTPGTRVYYERIIWRERE